VSDTPSFFSELKRRNVLRAAGLYLVGAWLVVQVAGTVLPMFGAPDWLPRTIVVLLAIAFVPALIFSWAFELTPQGLRRDEDVAAEQSIAPQTGRRMDRMIIAVLVLALGYFAVDKFVLAPRRQVAENNRSAPAVSPNDASANPKSIAVLPFENLSDDKANSYFANGIQDEILTRLAKIADLKVISRTSTLRYKSAPDNLREVGKQLGVANLLEGSVQKAGNAVHINVQLIKAATDAHLWAESYDRELQNIFGVEGEVAGAIADQLKAKLSGAEEKAIANKPTQNAAAYDAYLRGLAMDQGASYNDVAFEQAAGAYAEAVQLDPKFALAWARLAAARSYLFFNGIDPKNNSAAAVKDAADRAMALQPELGEAWIAQGSYLYRVQGNYSGGLHAFNEAYKRLPNSSFVLEYMAYVERRLGLWKEAEAHYKRAAELDPRSVAIFADMGGDFLNYLRRFDEAQAALDRALEITPNNDGVIASKASLFQSEGKLDESAKQLARIPSKSSDDLVVLARVWQAIYERRFDAAIALIQPKSNSVKPGSSVNALTSGFLVLLGNCQEWAGRSDAARASFARAVEVISPSVGSGGPLRWALAQAYAGLGDKTNALDQLRRLTEGFPEDVLAKASAEITLAAIQARFGDVDLAMKALPHLLEIPAGLNYSDLRNDPTWDPLRKDPRFQKLCQEPK